MRIAILEDDLEQAERLRLLLGAAGHAVHHATRGKALLATLKHESFDLLIIDWEVPDMSGVEVLKEVRRDPAAPTPVLFLTHRDSEHDIVEALTHGADDYLVKPPRERELLARIVALGRRSRAEPGQILELPPYRIDVAAATLTRDGVAIELTRKEFEVALFFFSNLGKVISRAHILQSVWGRGEQVSTRTVDTHVSRLRSALGLSTATGLRMTPVYGYGYRLEQVTGRDG